VGRNSNGAGKTPWLSGAEPSLATQPSAPNDDQDEKLQDVTLPFNGEWMAHYSERLERIYYEHRMTGFTTLDKQPRDAPSDWARLMDVNREKFYWYHTKTRETAWEPVNYTSSKFLQIEAKPV